MSSHSGFSLTLSSYLSSNHSIRSGSSRSNKPSGPSGSNKVRQASAICLLSAACSSLMGGGGGLRGLRRSRSASSRASMRRLYSRILWPCLPAGMTPTSFCSLQQIPKLVQALLQLFLLAYPTLELDSSKLGVGYLVRYRGCRSLRPALQDGGVEILQPSLDL